MKQRRCQTLIAGILQICCFLAVNSCAKAQISADRSLPTNVSKVGNVFEITGGSKVGSNLFHSFLEFSVPTNNTVFFNNTSDIGNIISRVTGGSLSNIDGLIRANGSANFILINPNGINFGPNAQLNIGGSFLGSTASSLKFADGVEFSATNSQTPPLLTISVPVGLQFGKNPSAINVQGTGHSFTVNNTIFSPVTRGSSLTGLRVQPGKTLALVGGNINLVGGTLTAEGGRIELGSVGEGLVSLNSTPGGWTLGYGGVPSFQDIDMRSQSSADASGASGGSIHIQGRNLTVEDGSVILIQNQGTQAAGAININTSESVKVSGTKPDGTIRSSITNETVGPGNGGDIDISTPQLVVEGGASVGASSYSQAKGGNVNVTAPQSVQVMGASAVNPSVTSSLVTSAFASGDSGDNTVSTGSLTTGGGGTIVSTTFGTGKGGNLNINASNSVDVTGVEPTLFVPSSLFAATFSAGNAGNVTINTPRLTVENGGRVGAFTFATGSSGNVNINAPDFVEVKGVVPGSVNPSLIGSSGNAVDSSLQQTFNLPPLPSGKSGNATINTGQLTVTDGAQVTVRNDGSGDAGTLLVNAGSILLDNQGGITAVTRGGKGGNINLQVQDSLQMSGTSQISSDNFGAGAGGNLTIDTGQLIVSNGAFLSSTTFGQGRGGDITVHASNSVELTGVGFEEYEKTFQVGVSNGTITPYDRGTGIISGTASSGISGNITIEAPSLLLQNGAIVFSPTFSTGLGGNININASKIELVGSALETGSAIGSNGSVGDININTGQLIVRDGAVVIDATFGNGAGGNVNLNASDSVELLNSPVDALVLTGIYTNTSLGQGKGGNVNIDTGQLVMHDAVIGSNTGALLPTGVIPIGGPGGNIVIKASDSVDLSGVLADPRFTTSISSTTYSNSRAGNLTISTGKLIVRDGADIATNSLGSGDAGTLTVNASQSIELSGTKVNGLTLGGLFAASGSTNLPDVHATGASGNIKVTTDKLIVQNGASIDVRSLGTGNAGNLEIVANSILLDNQGTLSAATAWGEGGNIFLQTKTLQLRHDSQISAQATGTGNGGNISITGFSPADSVVLLEGSKINANAVQGQGGNIQINTFGLFACPECQITASSQFGLNGVVRIISPETETKQEAIDLPQEIVKPEEIVAQVCPAKRAQHKSELIVTGRGGLPPRPNEPLSSEALTSFESSPSQAEHLVHSPIATREANTQLPPPAHGWYVNSKGTVVLTSQAPTSAPYSSGFPSSSCHEN